MIDIGVWVNIISLIESFSQLYLMFTHFVENKISKYMDMDIYLSIAPFCLLISYLVASRAVEMDNKNNAAKEKEGDKK